MDAFKAGVDETDANGVLPPRARARGDGAPDKIAGATIGWAVPYVKRHPDAQLSAWIAQAEYTGFRKWGGLPPD